MAERAISTSCDPKDSCHHRARYSAFPSEKETSQGTGEVVPTWSNLSLLSKLIQAMQELNFSGYCGVLTRSISHQATTTPTLPAHRTTKAPISRLPARPSLNLAWAWGRTLSPGAGCVLLSVFQGNKDPTPPSSWGTTPKGYSTSGPSWGPAEDCTPHAADSPHPSPVLRPPSRTGFSHERSRRTSRCFILSSGLVCRVPTWNSWW